MKTRRTFLQLCAVGLAALPVFALGRKTACASNLNCRATLEVLIPCIDERGNATYRLNTHGEYFCFIASADVRGKHQRYQSQLLEAKHNTDLNLQRFEKACRARLASADRANGIVKI